MHSRNIDDLPLAMTYTPWQAWESLYAPSEALKNGTLFPSLNLPFLAGEVCA